MLKNIQNYYGIQPELVDADCVAGESIAQYDLVYLDRTATTKTPGAADSIWAKVMKSPSSAPTAAILGVAQEAIASGARGRVRFVGQTIVNAVSGTFTAGTCAVIPASGGTAGKVSANPGTHTLTLPVGIIDVGGESATQITITLDGRITHAGILTPDT